MELASLTGKDVIHLSVRGRHTCTTREILTQVCSAPLDLAIDLADSHSDTFQDLLCIPFC